MDILRSLPGVGSTFLATRLAERTARGARRYQSLRTSCSVTPVTRSSGKGSALQTVVVMTTLRASELFAEQAVEEVAVRHALVRGFGKQGVEALGNIARVSRDVSAEIGTT